MESAAGRSESDIKQIERKAENVGSKVPAIESEAERLESKVENVGSEVAAVESETERLESKAGTSEKELEQIGSEEARATSVSLTRNSHAPAQATEPGEVRQLDVFDVGMAASGSHAHHRQAESEPTIISITDAKADHQAVDTNCARAQDDAASDNVFSETDTCQSKEPDVSFKSRETTASVKVDVTDREPEQQLSNLQRPGNEVVQQDIARHNTVPDSAFIATTSTAIQEMFSRRSGWSGRRPEAC
jgi:hypothetical protein